MIKIDITEIQTRKSLEMHVEDQFKKVHNLLHRLKVIQLTHNGSPILGWNITTDKAYSDFYLRREGF